MKETIEKIVNAWYQTYLNESAALGALAEALDKMDDAHEEPDTSDIDLFPADFKHTLESLLPQHVFSQISESEWIITSEL